MLPLQRQLAIGPPLSARRSNLAISGPCRARGPVRLALNSLVQPMKWEHLSTDTSIPGPEAAQSIIDCRNPFNQKDTSVTYMYELYPTNLRIPVVAISEEYAIPFPDYMDKKSCQRVVEDGMYIRNHDFNEMAKLVRLGF